MKQENRRENSILTDRLEFLYIEHAIIEQRDSSVCIIQGRSVTPIPIASTACLILGPGTTVTHRAVEALGDSGCLLVWSGDHMRTWYASGENEDRQSRNTLIQAGHWADPAKHMDVVRWMYKQRFPDMDMRGMPLEAMRGAEGLRMQSIYMENAKRSGIPWSGRKYDRGDFEGQEPIQQAITVGNKLLYNVCHAGILALGFSPTLGFIHTGKMRSFVYDLADLYKTEIVLPAAFAGTAAGKDLAHIRQDVRSAMQDNDLLRHIERDLFSMFGLKGAKPDAITDGLWNGENVVNGGLNYGK